MALLVLLGLGAALLLLPIDYEGLLQYGYVGIFVVTLLASATLAFPAPYFVAIFVAGSVLNPLLVALVAATAGAIGELTGYAAGYAGRRLLSAGPWYERLDRWTRRFGGGIVFLAAALPNPFFDAVGVVAGAMRLPLWVYLLACFFGKALRFWALAALGGVVPLRGWQL